MGSVMGSSADFLSTRVAACCSAERFSAPDLPPYGEPFALRPKLHPPRLRVIDLLAVRLRQPFEAGQHQRTVVERHERDIVKPRQRRWRAIDAPEFQKVDLPHPSMQHRIVEVVHAQAADELARFSHVRVDRHAALAHWDHGDWHTVYLY